MKAFANVQRCKACGLCISNCPRAAIHLTDKLNSGGYKTVAAQDDTCIGCGICYTVCPDGVFSIINEVNKEVAL